MSFKVKTAGGIKFNSTVALTRIDEKLVQMILQQYKIFNAEVRERVLYSVDYGFRHHIKVS